MAQLPPPTPQTAEAVEAAAVAAAAAKRRASALRAAGLIAGIAVVLGILNAVTHGDFLAPGNVVNVLRQISVNAILAAGQTFVIITEGIGVLVGLLIRVSVR